MKRLITWTLCVLLVLGLFSGCGQDEAPYVPTGNALVMDDGSTVATAPRTEDDMADRTVSLTYYPDRSMNPLLCTDLTNRTIFSLIYQSLFVVDRNYQVEPMLCKGFSVSEDMKTYTFYLENATFSDGSRLTANDVVASLNAARESKYYGGRFYYFSDIVATEDGAVTIYLTTPYENLPILLDIPIIKATQLEADTPLGTGPFAMEMTVNGIQLRRRSDWWCTADLVVRTDFIHLMEAESPTQIRDNFEFAGLDLVCANPGSDSYADYRCDYELWDSESGTFVYLGCNLESPLFSNPTVRAALTYAIDRDTLAESFYRGFGQSATLPASPNSPYYNQGLAAHYGYDPLKFTEALESTGNIGAKVRLLVNSDDSLRLRTARAIADMLTECGLVVEMLELGSGMYKDSLFYRTYDLYVGQTKLSANMDLTHFFYTWGELSYGKLYDPALFVLCQEALANSGNYNNLHKAVMEDGRLCPVLFYSYAVYATRGLLTQLQPARDNVFYYSLGKTMEEVQFAAPAE